MGWFYGTNKYDPWVRLAWNYIHPNEYISEQCDDKVHFRIKGFTSNWRSAQRLNIFDLLHENELEDDDDSRVVAGEEMKLDSETLGSKLYFKKIFTKMYRF